MNINAYISEKDLKSLRTIGIWCVILGCCIPYVGLLLLVLGASMIADHKRLKKETAYLRQYPTTTFTQMAGALGMKHTRVCNDMEYARKQKVLQFVEVDLAGDCLRYLPVTAEAPPVAPPPPPEERATVSCPNCGAPVTISTKLGGQCEYCDSWLPGTE